MSAELLTRHNPLLSQPSEPAVSGFEDNFTSELGPAVTRFVQESLSSATRSAYLSDLQHFKNWGGVIPAAPEVVANYLAECAETFSVATLVRRVAAISKAHEARALLNPTKAELVRATVRGIKRTCGTAQKEAAPLVREDLFQVLAIMGDQIKDVRDRALLLVGFAGGFRRSELVALTRADVESVRQGIIITIQRSKSDQAGAGRKLAIPHGRTQNCPVEALERWLERGKIVDGPIFRRIDRYGNVGASQISGEAVSLIVRERLERASMDATAYSGHSLRAGFATSAAQAGIPSWQIRRQTGHASDAMLSRYIRLGELFTDNAAGRIL